MGLHVAVSEYSWDEGTDLCWFYFIVYKKKLFGGLKPDRRFACWKLVLPLLNDNEIDVQNISLQDGNIRTVNDENHNIPIELHHLVIAIFLAGAKTLREAGEEPKAKMIDQARDGFFKKYILK